MAPLIPASELFLLCIEKEKVSCFTGLVFTHKYLSGGQKSAGFVLLGGFAVFFCKSFDILRSCSNSLREMRDGDDTGGILMDRPEILTGQVKTQTPSVLTDGSN